MLDISLVRQHLCALKMSLWSMPIKSHFSWLWIEQAVYLVFRHVHACKALHARSFLFLASRALEVLPKAPAPEPRKLTTTELKRLQNQEESTLRELRLFLRETLNKLGRDRKFGLFAKPVDIEDVRLHTQWSLYFTTLYFKTTKIIRPSIFVQFVCCWTSILRRFDTLLKILKKFLKLSFCKGNDV